MSIASWGSKKFNASSKKVYTFDGFTNSAALNLESQDNEGGKSFTAIKGIDTEKLGFVVKLDRAYVDVAAEIKSWKARLAAKKPYPLYIGKKKFGTLPWLLASVDVSEMKIGPHGAMISAAVELGFEEIYQLKPPTQNTGSSGSGSAASMRTTTSSSGSGSSSTSSVKVYNKPIDYISKAVKLINSAIKSADIAKDNPATYKKLQSLITAVSKLKDWSKAKSTLLSTLKKLVAETAIFYPKIAGKLQSVRLEIQKWPNNYTGVVSSLGGAALVSFAKTQLGKPYVLGAKGPSKFDCSGFVYYCLKSIGIKISYMTAATWAGASAYTKVKSMNDLKLGDIVCFSGSAPGKGHVGIYLGNGTMIDASSSDGKVRISSPLKSSSYWTSHFICGRRVV